MSGCSGHAGAYQLYPAICGWWALQSAGAVFYFHFRHKQPQYHPSETSGRCRGAFSVFLTVLISLFLIFCLLACSCFFQIFSGIPLYYKDIYHKPNRLSIVAGFNGLIVFFEMGTASSIEKRANREKLIFIGSAMLAVSLVMLNMAQEMLFSSFRWFWMSFSEMFAMPFMISHVVKRRESTRQLSRRLYHCLVCCPSFYRRSAAPSWSNGSVSICCGGNGRHSVITAFGFMRKNENNFHQPAIDSAPSNQNKYRFRCAHYSNVKITAKRVIWIIVGCACVSLHLGNNRDPLNIHSGHFIRTFTVSGNQPEYDIQAPSNKYILCRGSALYLKWRKNGKRILKYHGYWWHALRS